MTRRAIIAALIIAAFLTGRATATPRPDPHQRTPSGVSQPQGWLVGGGLTEAPQPVIVSGVGQSPRVDLRADATARSEGGSGASPSPAALSTGDTAPSEPTASAASTPGSSQSTWALTGTASWYCLSKRSACTVGYPASGLYAAAGPRLRSALGPGWRGKVVTVTANGRSVVVRLVDTCQCYGSRLIDLYASAFARLAPLSVGLVRVTVAW